MATEVEKDSSSDESECEDKITTVKETPVEAAVTNLAQPSDELEYQLAAEKREQEKIAAGHYWTDPTDGTCYEWDTDQQAWFPRITEDFLAAYQMSYGVSSDTKVTEVDCRQSSSEKSADSTPLSEATPTPTPENNVVPNNAVPKEQGFVKKQKKAPEWFDLDQSKNTWVYISGLPLDMTSEDFLALVGKYGLIMEDPETEKKKFKMYTDEEGKFKGDAKCCYLRMESIPLAVQMLNGTKFPGATSKVKIEQATFQMKGQFNPKLKPKKKNNKKKKNKKQENLLDWRDRAGGTDLRPKHAKIVIMKHCFDPKEFIEDATMITEVRDDIKEECEKFGPVKKVLLFDRHPEGVVSVKFGTHEAAEDAVKAFDKRWFGGKQIEASQWDGVKDYAIEETAMAREVRLAGWNKFLEGDDDNDSQKKATVVSNKLSESSETAS